MLESEIVSLLQMLAELWPARNLTDAEGYAWRRAFSGYGFQECRDALAEIKQSKATPPEPSHFHRTARRARTGVEGVKSREAQYPGCYIECVEVGISGSVGYTQAFYYPGEVPPHEMIEQDIRRFCEDKQAAVGGKWVIKWGPFRLNPHPDSRPIERPARSAGELVRWLAGKFDGKRGENPDLHAERVRQIKAAARAEQAVPFNPQVADDIPF